MFRSFGCFFVLWLALATASDLVPGAVWKGYYSDRSGDIILQEENMSAESILIFLGKDVFLATEQIEETRVGDLIAHVFGLPPLNPQLPKDGFPPCDYFSKPKANLLLIVDTEANLSDLDVSGKRYILSSESYPYDPVARTYSQISSHPPSEHGVIQKEWYSKAQGEGVKAFASWDPVREGAVDGSVQDVMSVTYAGKSLVFSSSSEFSMARALAAKPFILPSDNNNHAFYWNADKKTYESTYEEQPSAMTLSHRVLLQFLARYNTELGAKYSEVDDQFYLSLSDNSRLVFDLTQKEEVAFLSEVAFAQMFFAELRNNVNFRALTEDGFPDFYSFAFSSVKPLEAKHKQNPTMRAGILRLLSTTISKMVADFTAQYNGDVLTEFIASSTSVPLYQKAVTERLYNLLPSHLLQGVFYPQIYLSELADKTQICNLVENALADMRVAVHCMPSYSVLHNDAYRETVRLIKRDNTTDGPTSDDIAIFQIVLWTAVALIITTIGTYLCMLTLDASKDGILYNTITAAHPKSS